MLSRRGTTPLLIPIAGVLAAALLVWVCRRWHQGRSRTRWLAVALLVPAAFPFAVFVALNLPSASCTGETRLAYAAWVDEGAIGQPPHECAKY